MRWAGPNHHPSLVQLTLVSGSLVIHFFLFPSDLYFTLGPLLCILPFGKFTNHCFRCCLYVKNSNPTNLFLSIFKSIVWHLKMWSWEKKKETWSRFHIYSFTDGLAKTDRHAWGPYHLTVMDISPICPNLLSFLFLHYFMSLHQPNWATVSCSTPLTHAHNCSHCFLHGMHPLLPPAPIYQNPTSNSMHKLLVFLLCCLKKKKRREKPEWPKGCLDEQENGTLNRSGRGGGRREVSVGPAHRLRGQRCWLFPNLNSTTHRCTTNI